MLFCALQMAGKVNCHKYSRRRPSEGWKFTVEKLGSRGKRGGGGGWKFVSLPDGSSRPLDEMEKMYVKRETPRHRRKIIPWYVLNRNNKWILIFLLYLLFLHFNGGCWSSSRNKMKIESFFCFLLFGRIEFFEVQFCINDSYYVTLLFNFSESKNKS